MIHEVKKYRLGPPLGSGSYGTAIPCGGLFLSPFDGGSHDILSLRLHFFSSQPLRLEQCGSGITGHAHTIFAIPGIQTSLISSGKKLKVSSRRYLYSNYWAITGTPFTETVVFLVISIAAPLS